MRVPDVESTVTRAVRRSGALEGAGQPLARDHADRAAEEGEIDHGHNDVPPEEVSGAGERGFREPVRRWALITRDR
jgi:hypothetical protein